MLLLMKVPVVVANAPEAEEDNSDDKDDAANDGVSIICICILYDIYCVGLSCLTIKEGRNEREREREREILI